MTEPAMRGIFNCSSCQTPLIDTVSTLCDYKFCRECVEKRLQCGTSCPLCRQSIKSPMSFQWKQTEHPFSLLKPISILTISDYQFLPEILLSPITTTYRNQTLEQMIAELPHRSRIILQAQNLTDQDLEIVIKHGVKEKQCSQLDLGSNVITSLSVSIIADALHNNRTLNRLYLSDNRVYDLGIRSLTQALSMDDSVLRVLGLSENGITSEGAHSLAEMLKTNKGLFVLGLENNEIDNAGVELLANALAYHNTTLQRLLLRSNKLVNDSSCDCLIHMLQHNLSLKRLDIRDCNLSESGKARLQEVVKFKQDFELWK